jgi:hypothetical protein
VTGCPVCRAAFRGVPVCPRCGADLAPLMLLAVRAWKLRQAAREALAAGNFVSARRLAEEAQKLQSTPAGWSIHAVAQASACGATEPRPVREQWLGLLQ